MADCLSKGVEARKYAITLGSLEYSGDLTKQLLDFSAKMEKVFKALQDLIDRKVSDPSAFKKHIDIIDEKLAWYEKAEAAGWGIHINDPQIGWWPKSFQYFISG